jgi:hypothetical protein
LQVKHKWPMICFLTNSSVDTKITIMEVVNLHRLSCHQQFI